MAFEFLIGGVLLFALLDGIGRNFQELMHRYFSFNNLLPLQPKALIPLLHDSIMFVLITIIPLLVCLLLIGVFANYLQVGKVLTLEPIKPQLKRLNPVQGFKNMFKPAKFFELAKNVVKITVSFLLFYLAIRGELKTLAHMGKMDLRLSFHLFGKMMFGIILKIALVYILMSVVDFVFQKKQFKKQMMMSKQEVKDEYKETEGDPQVKQQRQQMAQEIGNYNMTEDVKNADAVVVNPDEVAVAIRYDSKQMPAPRVMAKGKNYLAAKIKEVAKANNVPIITNINLAHSLFSLDIGADIPEDLYDAVAEVLNYVYKLAQEQGEA